MDTATVQTEIVAAADGESEQKSEHFVIGIFLVICIVIAVVGNGMILVMFGKYRHLRTPSNALILVLAVIDIGMAFICFPVSAWSSFSGKWPLGDRGCNYYGFLSMLSGLSIIGLLALMAIDRYIVICRRNAAASLGLRHYVVAIVIVFLNAAFWAIMPILGWSSYAVEPSKISCGVDYQNNDVYFVTYLVALFIFCFVLPLTLMVLCYWRAHSVMSKREEVNSAISDESTAPINVEWVNQREVTQMGALLVLLFLLSWSMEAVVCLWAAFGKPDNIPYQLTLVAPLAVKSSIILNPLVITVMIGKFRSHIAIMLRPRPEVNAALIDAPRLDTPDTEYEL